MVTFYNESLRLRDMRESLHKPAISFTQISNTAATEPKDIPVNTLVNYTFVEFIHY